MATFKNFSDIVAQSNTVIGLKPEGPLFVRNDNGVVETWQFERDGIPTGPKMSVIQPRASTFEFNPDGSPVMSKSGEFQKRASQTLAMALGLATQVVKDDKGGEHEIVSDLESLTLVPVTLKEGNEYAPRKIAAGNGKVKVQMYCKVLNGKFAAGTKAYAACHPVSDGSWTWKRVEVADPRENATPEAKVVRMLTGFQLVVMSEEVFNGLHLTDNAKSFKAQDIGVYITRTPDGKTASGLELGHAENRNLRFNPQTRKPAATQEPTTSGKIKIGQVEDGVETPWGNPVNAKA